MVNIINFSSNIFPSTPLFLRKCEQMMSSAQVWGYTNLDVSKPPCSHLEVLKEMVLWSGIFIVFIAGSHLGFLVPHMRISLQCILPTRHQLMRMCGVMRMCGANGTRMPAGYENDEYLSF
jgi:hypothetical protein